MSKIIQGKHLHGDLFGDAVPEKHQYAILDVIAKSPQTTFILITKNPQNVCRKTYDPTDDVPLRRLGRGDCLPNLWLGVTVENQQDADERIPILLQTPAAVRFVSCEPLLSAVDLTRVIYDRVSVIDCLRGYHGWPVPHADGPRVDWIICGGETGPGARPVHPDWVRSLRDQCQAANTPFLFAGWGGSNEKTDRLLDGQVWDEYPEEYPEEYRGEYPEED